ncbi:Metal tolerance protein C4 [Sesamum angolense]|uniref:Metal tolerance protein C4 n=1 Tax=Sesamum angolense TaxID=2727404 RepID=A0AAE1WKP5_9LAMI|nr:Metal tolerance protein C4 [Sesamum angolense]
MRTSRLLSRLRHHRYHYSPFTCSIAQIHISCPSTEPENPTLQENKFINHPRLLHCDISIPPRFSQRLGFASFRNFLAANSSSGAVRLSNLILPSSSYHQQLHFTRGLLTRAKKIEKIEVDDHGQRAVTTALWCNFLVFSLKFGVWLSSSSHVMLAEVVHSVADFANQALLAYGLSSSRRAPDALHPVQVKKIIPESVNEFHTVLSDVPEALKCLINQTVICLFYSFNSFCTLYVMILTSAEANTSNDVRPFWCIIMLNLVVYATSAPEHIEYAALVIGGSFVIEGASLFVAVNAVRKGAAAEGMKVRDYVWRGHDPTAVAVMTEDGAAVTGLAIAAASLVAVKTTGNAIYDPIGSIIVGNLLGMVAIFLIQRNRHALIGRAIDDNDMERVLHFLKNDPVVDAVYDCKSEVIGPGFFRFKAEIDFNGVVLVQNYLSRTGREEWAKQFREAAKEKDNSALLKVMANYGTVCSIASFLSYYSARTKSCVLAGEEVVTALGSEVDRLEKEIQEIVPGIRHVDIEAHNPIVPSP